MKKIIYILSIFTFMFSCILNVNASCTDDVLEQLEEEASNIKISYKHLEDENGYSGYNNFEVTVSNLNDDLYIMITQLEKDLKLSSSDGENKAVFTSGTWIFNVYSNMCEVKISEIEVELPKFNLYSLDPLCDGIDGSDFALCGKYYEYDVSYENFVERVKHYRITHNIDSNSRNGNAHENSFFDKVLEFVSKYYMVFLSITIAVLVLVIFVIVKKRKKRGVLE